ncbi:MAG: hypothetical protein OHK0022_19610 [Roseiflexaceae bacterium]
MLDFETIRPRIDRFQRLALIVGVVAAIIAVAWAFFSPAQFFHSYLYAYLFWFGLSIGGMAAVMLHHMVGGGWGAIIRRFLENSAMMIPVMGILFIPILIFGMPYLYEWTNPEIVAEDPIIRAKTLYLDWGFFAVRTILYFLIWTGMALLLNRWSNQQDQTADPGLLGKFKTLSAPGLVIYVLTMTFAAFDWGMSLEPHWFSSIYGVIYIVGQALSALSFAIIMLYIFHQYRPLAEFFSVNRLHDIGKLMFAFVVLWTYINVSQLLIMYSGDIAEETPWYIVRSNGGWEFFAIFLGLFQFATPFFILLSRRTKRTLNRMVYLAVALLVVRHIDLFWLIQPAFYRDRVNISPLDFILPVALGGIWLGIYLQILKRRPIAAFNSPVIQGKTPETIGAFMDPHHSAK